MPDFLLEGLNPTATETVKKGWLLWSWKDWENQAEQLRAEELKRRSLMQFELANPIISLRNQSKGELLWSEVGGLQIRD